MSVLQVPALKICRQCCSVLQQYCLVRSISTSSSPILKRLGVSSLTYNNTYLSNWIPKQPYTQNTAPVANETTAKLSKRVGRKKTPESQDQPGGFKVSAYATASEYHLEDLMAHIEKDGLYEQNSLPSDLVDAKYLTAKYMIDTEARTIVVFRQGTVVFWNVPMEERANFMRSLKSYENHSYDSKVVDHESETLDYMYAGSEDGLAKSKINQDLIVLATSEDSVLDRYAFSNGLMQSVQLAVWEACLAEYIESIEEVTENLREGGRLQLSRKEVLQKTGELFNLSHRINLSSDLLDTPDFYWDRDELEKLYQKSQTYFNIHSRTKVMNNKLSHCMDLVDLLRDHLNTQHEVRLEWMIIVLILVEVIFEIVHVAERKLGKQAIEPVEK